MKKWVSIIVVTGALLGWYVATGFTDQSSPEYQKALGIAEAVDAMVRSTRAKYTKDVVIKLKKDGAGAALDSKSKKGFAPLPAQFVRAIAFDVAIKQKKAGQERFAFFLRSRWNLNPEQGIQDDFEKEGWKFLVQQQEAALKAGMIQAPSQTALFAGNQHARSGWVGATLHGAIELETVVAQGCRPIGAPMFVTSGAGNFVRELDGRSPIAILADTGHSDGG